MTSQDADGLDTAGEDSLDYLPHPPFAFHKVPYSDGSVLRAVGYNEAGEAVLEKTLAASGKPAKILLEADSHGIPLRAAQNNMLLVRAYVLDEAGNLCTQADNSIYFRVTQGDASVVGDGDALCSSNPIRAETGIASCILRGGKSEGKVEITADSCGLTSGALTVDVLPSEKEEAAFTPLKQGALYAGVSKNLCDYSVENETSGLTTCNLLEEDVLYPGSLLSEADCEQNYCLNGGFQKLFLKLVPTGAEYRVYLDGVLRFRTAPTEVVSAVVELENAEMLTLKACGGEGKWLSPYLLEGQWKPDDGELRVNLAKGKKAAASVNSEKVSAVISSGREYDMWIGVHPRNESVFWQMDLEQPVSIRNVKASIGGLMGADSTNFTYEILTSSDGVNWEKKAENKRTAWSNGVLDYFTASNVRYIRISFLAIDGTMPASLTGFEVYPDFGVDSVAEYNLKGISTEEYDLTFVSNKTEYTLPVLPSYTVRALPMDSNASVRINGKPIRIPASCTMLRQVESVMVDALPCEIEVTAANGIGKKTYVLKNSDKVD